MNTSRTAVKKVTALAALPFVAVLSLSACGSEEPEETAYTQSENGVEMTLTYTHVGDEVVKQTASNVIDYEAAGFGTKEQAQEILDPLLAQSDGIEGYEVVMEYGETTATEEVTIDYEVIDMADLQGIPSFEGSANLEDADYISLEESRDILESQGFTEVE